jgi:hypothetical protein
VVDDASDIIDHMLLIKWYKHQRTLLRSELLSNFDACLRGPVSYITSFVFIHFHVGLTQQLGLFKLFQQNTYWGRGFQIVLLDHPWV